MPEGEVLLSIEVLGCARGECGRSSSPRLLGGVASAGGVCMTGGVLVGAQVVCWG